MSLPSPQLKILQHLLHHLEKAGVQLRGTWNQLSIGKKLNFAFGILVLLTFLAVGRTYLSNVRANSSIRYAQAVRMPTALASVSAQANLLRMLADLRGYMATGESYFRDRYQQSRQAFEAELMQMGTLLQPSTANGVRLSELQQTYDSWSKLPDQLFRLRDTPLENQPALALLETEGQVPMRRIDDNAEAVLADLRNQASSSISLRLLDDWSAFQNSFIKMSTGLQSYLITLNPSFRYDYSEALQTNEVVWRRLQQQRQQLSPEQQQRLAAIAADRQKFLELPEQLFDLVEGDQRRQDLYLFRETAEPLALEMIAILDEIVADEQNRLAKELRRGQGEQVQAQWQTLSIGLLALLTGATMALVLQRQIIHPIQRLTQATTQIKSGRLGVKASAESKDEIGALAAAFNHMSDYLQQSHQELEHYSQTLEQRVAVRTDELQQKNHQLEALLRDLRKTQAQLIQTEKMSGLGQMVAGVAHEINNPVNFIYGNLKHLENYVQGLLELIALYQHQVSPAPLMTAKMEEIDLEFLIEDLPKTLNSMQIGASRIREIVMTLRNFARLDEAAMKEADIHLGIESTLMILQAKLKSHQGEPICVVKQFGQLPLVECYPGQLNQVLMNILANAIDALESYDRPAHRDPKTITIETRCDRAADTVIICIRDNGPGMDEKTLQHLFEPFYTTKPVGRGTGLGLSISHQIVVENHHGQLFCHSELGKGTEFQIEIPLCQSGFWSSPQATLPEGSSAV